MLDVNEFKGFLIAKMIEEGFPAQMTVQGTVQDTGLERFCEAIAKAVVEYIKTRAEVHILPGTVVVSVQGPGVSYTLNPADIVLGVR